MDSELSHKLEKEAKEQRKKDLIALARELKEVAESLPFPGMDSDIYSKMKKDLEGYPDFSAPIDELLERFSSQGMKVMFGDDPESGVVYVLPAQSSDIHMDSLFPRHLQITEGMDERVKNLILLNKSLI